MNWEVQMMARDNWKARFVRRVAFCHNTHGPIQKDQFTDAVLLDAGEATVSI